jgi:hypothetical protein
MASTALEPKQSVQERQWYIVGRWQEIEGEARVNLLRIIAIGVFYSIELASQQGLFQSWLQLGPAVNAETHQIVTAIAVAWTLVALAVYFMLREQIFPAGLKYATTACDTILLTSILTVAYGPRSAMVVGYFLIIALSGLRFQLRLVWCATLSCIAAYLFLLAYAAWFAPESVRAAMTVPRYQQLIVLVTLAALGVIVGQIVRRVKTMAEDYAKRLEQRRVGQ